MPRLLSPEARLLWLAVTDDGQDEPIRTLVRSGVHWRRLAWLAEVERAAPVVHARLARALGRDALPPEASVLTRLAMVERLHLQLTAAKLTEVVELLSGAGIPVMLLKGSALAVGIYGSFDERPMVDLDLLVPGERLEEARRRLGDAGWRWSADSRFDEFYAAHHHLPPLVSGRGFEARVELHGSLVAASNPFRLDGRALWAGGSRVPVGKGEAWIPSAEWMVLHACVHFAWSHAMGSGAWRTFRDVDAVATRHPSFAWERFVALVQRCGAGPASYWTLQLGRTLAAVRVPAEVLRALTPRRSVWLRRLLERHFAFRISHLDDSCPSVSVNRAMWRLAAGQGLPRTSDPWLHGNDFPLPAPSDAVPSEAGVGELAAVRSVGADAAGGSRIVRHLRNAGGWSRYLGTVLTADLTVVPGVGAASGTQAPH